MTNAELILKLVEMLIESEKKQNAQTANEQTGQTKDKYITSQKGVVASICYSFLLYITKEMPSSIAPLSNYMTSAEHSQLLSYIYFTIKMGKSQILQKRFFRKTIDKR